MSDLCQLGIDGIIVLMNGTESVLTQLGTLSYLGIWGVSFLSNMVIPVPEEITLLLFGYLSSIKDIPLYILLPVIMSGLLANDIIIYSLARRGSKAVTFIYERFFKRRLSKKGDAWLNHHMATIVFVSRFLMQLRFIGPFMAGQKHYPFKKFILYDMAAIALYVPIFVLLGRYFHYRVEMIVKDIGVIKNIVLIVVGVIVAYMLMQFAARTLFNKNEKQKN